MRPVTTLSPHRAHEDDGAMDIVQRIEHHTRTLDRNVRITQMADAKAAPALALQALIGVAGKLPRPMEWREMVEIAHEDAAGDHA